MSSIATEWLEQNGYQYELLPHSITMSAREEAHALGVKPEEVGKTLVLVTPQGNVRVVVPADERLDLHKARELLGDGQKTRLATERELAEAYPQFELGAVPPFGGPQERVLVDRRIAALPSVVVEAGTHSESLRLKPADLVALTRADVGDLCE